MILTLVPFIYGVLVTLQDYSLLKPPKWVGLTNYINVLRDPRFAHASLISLKYSVICVAFEIIIGFGVAIVLHYGINGQMAKSIVRTLMLVPMMVTPVVAGLSWRIIYDPDAGILNYFLNLLGIHSNKAWLANAKTALYAVSAVDIWQWTPFIILITLAGLESLPVDIYEAAEVDGATWTQAFRYITIPLLSTTIFLALLIRTIDVLKFFDLILIMTNGGPGTVTETLNMYAYKTGFVYFRFGYASTIAFIYTLVVSLVLPFFVNRIWAEGG